MVTDFRDMKSSAVLLDLQGCPERGRSHAMSHRHTKLANREVQVVKNNQMISAAKREPGSLDRALCKADLSSYHHYLPF